MSGILNSFVGGSYGAIPSNTVAPAVTGTAAFGSTLTTTTGCWNASPAATYAYQWYRGCTAISGATSNTRVLAACCVGYTMKAKVTATNNLGSTSAFSNTTSTVTAIAPGAPTIGTATATGSTTASIAFTAPSCTGGASITGYQATCVATGTHTATGSSSPITITGLSAGTSYQFKVRAQNSVGYGAYSGNSNSITTPNPVTVSYLVVAGGGSGGYNIGGGGGGGGVLQSLCNSSVMYTGTTYIVTVGAGAPLGAHYCGNGAGVKGYGSSISGVISTCGGGRAAGSGTNTGGAGGSGGGSYGPNPGGSPVAGQGYKGAAQPPYCFNCGCCFFITGYGNGGGGGGAQAANFYGPQGGYGGSPFSTTITGSTIKVAGGAGAGAASGSGGYGNGGLPYACGGGGAGFPYGSSGHYCYCGKPHTGGGGGGGANGGSGNGGTGGSGIVIIKACRVAVSVCGGTGPTCVGGKKMYVFNTSGSITF